MANSAGAPKICSMRTIKSDVVVGLGQEGDEVAEKLDKEEAGWKISGKYVSFIHFQFAAGYLIPLRLLFCYLKADLARKLDLHEQRAFFESL